MTDDRPVVVEEPLIVGDLEPGMDVLERLDAVGI